MLSRFDLNKTYQFLLIILAFMLPLTVFGANIIIAVIVFLWLVSGNYKSKFDDVTKSKVVVASLLFYFIHLLGLFWTEDLQWGLTILRKMWYFLLLLPILYNIVKNEFVKFYILAFLIAMLFTQIISYLIWFEFIPEYKHATIINPTPFMSHISYNPILAFAIYLVSYEIFFNKDLGKIKFLSYSFFAAIMTFNMFITGGRAGYVMFFAMVTIVFFQIFNNDKLKAFIYSGISVPLIFFLAYLFSDLFQHRVDTTIHNLLSLTEAYGKETSEGLRINFAQNSWEIIKQNLFFGVGTGDFPSEYYQVNVLKSINIRTTNNPHNMYILIQVQLGLIGLMSFLSIFYYQMKFSLSSSTNFYKYTGLTLPLLFLLIMLSDSYLLGHFTSLLFIFFSSFLYKKFEEN
jgi:O-antigen ligase